MKILKQGNYKSTEYLFKCSSCGCVFVEYDIYCGFSYEVKTRNYYLSCECPCCECSCTSDTIYTEEKEDNDNV